LTRRIATMGAAIKNKSAGQANPRALSGRQESIDVPVRIEPAGRTPIYATGGSAGCDLFAARPLTLRPGETRLLPIGLVMALEPGVEAQIRPRSGLSLKTTLRLPNAPGTIDSDFRDGVAVLLQNTFTSSDLAGCIASRPETLAELESGYCRVTLAEYLQQLASTQPADPARTLLAEKYPDLAGQILYIDKHGNPYGTLYIQPGDRIAQMVFSRYLRAFFIEHPEPEGIGTDRGGGFGSTGL
jgi:dUTP pyrophosphatase